MSVIMWWEPEVTGEIIYLIHIQDQGIKKKIKKKILSPSPHPKDF